MHLRLRIIPILSVFVLSGAMVCGQKAYYPESAWQRKNPAEVNMSPALIDSAVRFALASEEPIDRDLRIADIKAYSSEPDYRILGPVQPRGGPAGLLIKNGYIVASWGDVDRVDMTFSGTKSYLSSIAGLALDEGLIHSIDDKAAAYVWDGTFDGVHNQKITWRHLLTQSSDWSGNLFGLYDWADRPPATGGIDEWKNRQLFEPGEHFKYNDVRVNVLAYALLQVWRKPLPAVLKEKILDPIGASTTWRWYGYDNSFVNIDGIMMQSVSGGGHFGGGLFTSTIDQARYGLLFLRKGKWKDRQLISEKWVNAAHQPSVANKTYGYLWWINGNTWPALSPEVYSAQGFGGNYIIVDNEHDLVIVARWMDGKKLPAFLDLVVKSLKK